jgi:hypothetical protein
MVLKLFPNLGQTVFCLTYPMKLRDLLNISSDSLMGFVWQVMNDRSVVIVFAEYKQSVCRVRFEVSRQGEKAYL